MRLSGQGIVWELGIEFRESGFVGHRSVCEDGCCPGITDTMDRYSLGNERTYRCAEPSRARPDWVKGLGTI